jgi:hypothetical protein
VGSLFEVVVEGSGWAGAELEMMARSMNFERVRTGAIYAVNFITDEDGAQGGDGALHGRPPRRSSS